MLAVLVIGLVFGSMFVLTWLSSRAEAAQTRCDEHLRHIQHHLEIPPTSGGRPDRRTPHGSH